MSLFEDLETAYTEQTSIKPFHTLDKKKEKDKLDWLNTVIQSLERQSIPRNAEYRSNLLAYRGQPNVNSKVGVPRTSEKSKINRIGKFVVNHLHDMTETKVSQMCRIKPAVDILPTNDEFKDKNAAKAVKLLIDHIWYTNNIDEIMQKLQRQSRIFGESYLFIEWDEEAGDLHPIYVEARDSGQNLIMRDARGNIEFDSKGAPIEIDPENEVRIGDIKYSIELPWRVFLQRKNKLEDVEYCFRTKVVPIEDLKKDFPSKAKKVKATTQTKLFEVDNLTERLLEDETIVYEFFHKSTKHLNKGSYICFTKDIILEQSELPYSHGQLPFERLTDMDVPEVLNGVSNYEMLRPLQNMHNNLSTLLAKNIYLTGHAKWVMPRGACKIEALGNDSTIVQYQGPRPPELLQTRPNPPEAYNFRDMLVQEMGQVYGVQGVSRGAPPPGITAGVALQFLNEQEQERSNGDIVKHTNTIQNIAKKTISVAGDYYAPDDGRMLRVLGKDQKFSLRHFDAANLTKDYDVRVALGSTLSETKAGKIQRIVEIMQLKPDLLSNERWIDLLEFGNTERMTTLLTSALRAAESENEDLLSGKYVHEPQIHEDHIIHWNNHVKAIQGRSFKEETPAKIQQNMLEHIATTEYAMIEKAQSSPLFEAKLAQLPLFPIFPSGFLARSREQQTMVVQGEANRGSQITGQIPGEENIDLGEPFANKISGGGQSQPKPKGGKL